jgi:hypothetical protein
MAGFSQSAAFRTGKLVLRALIWMVLIACFVLDAVIAEYWFSDPHFVLIAEPAAWSAEPVAFTWVDAAFLAGFLVFQKLLLDVSRRLRGE